MSAQSLAAETNLVNSPIQPSIGGIANPPSAESVVRARARVIERFRGALRMIQEADAIARSAHLDGLKVRIQVSSQILASLDAEEVVGHVQRAIDTSGWRYVIGESNLRKLLVPLVHARWMRRLDEGEVLELTMENVAYMVQAACDAHHERLEREDRAQKHQGQSLRS
jgi:hypothetical protein